jgi:hypothetical protein
MPENDEKRPQVDPTRSLKVSYPSNSNKNKKQENPTEKRVEKLEGIVVIEKKPSIMRRIRQSFTGDDARSLGDFLLFEVALPAIKTTMFDLINQGANRALFGAGGTPGVANRRPGVVNYNQISRNQVNAIQASQSYMTKRDQATHNFDSIIFPTRSDAERVLTRLLETIAQYDFVAVSDLYELVDVTGSFADDRYGWTNLDGANIVSVRGGFVLDLPDTKPIR